MHGHTCGIRASQVSNDIGFRGVLLNNVGSCLHHLEDFEVAAAHYELVWV